MATNSHYTIESIWVMNVFGIIKLIRPDQPSYHSFVCSLARVTSCKLNVSLAYDELKWQSPVFQIAFKNMTLKRCNSNHQLDTETISC